MNYNEFLGIWIPKVLMNLISCHEFIKEIHSTIIVLCHTWLMEYYLAKVLIILEHNSKNLSSVHNEAKQRIHAFNINKTDFVMDPFLEKKHEYISFEL